MIQEQNEAGALDTVRCFLSESNKIFDGQVSDCLVRAMHKRPGTWQEVFGKDADESFSTLGDLTLDQRGREGRKSGVPAAHGCECMAGYAGWPDESGSTSRAAARLLTYSISGRRSLRQAEPIKITEHRLTIFAVVFLSLSLSATNRFIARFSTLEFHEKNLDAHRRFLLPCFVPSGADARSPYL